MSCQCDGRCCAVFTYTSTPEELHQQPWKGNYSQRDNLYIADMLVPLTTQEAEDRVERFGIQKVNNYDDQQWYTCRHWDEETQLCGAYDERPQMCAEYPYDRACDHGCGFKNSVDLIGMIERRRIDDGLVTNITLGEN